MSRSKLSLNFIVVLSLLGSFSFAAEEKKQMYVLFEGKGTVVGWDFGFAKGLYEKLNPSYFEPGAVVFGGASSGVFPSAYFACHGITPTSLAFAEANLPNFSRKIIDENFIGKALKLFFGLPTEAPHSNVDKLVDLVTDNKTCVPKFPLMITASNLEIIDVRPENNNGKSQKKSVNYENFNVSFEKKVQGKACTYFMTPDLAKKFSTFKKEELLCDIRPIETGADLYLAMRAGFSEPTYFAPTVEPKLEKISSAFEPIQKRVYGGSFALLVLTQDIKKLFPDMWMIGSGRSFQPRAMNRIMINWLTVDVNLTNIRSMYYLDFDVLIPDAEYDYLQEIEIADQAKVGYKAFYGCFKDRDCVNYKIIKPKSTLDFYGSDLGKKVQRGISALLR